MTSETSSKPLARVIVIGGSIAGCLAAAAVAPYAREIIIVDRDDLPAGVQPRKGVPQGPHFHALLAAGRQAIDELVPGFSEEAIAHGAARLDAVQDVTRLDRIGWSPRFPSNLEFLMASRALIEYSIRKRTMAIDGIEFRIGTEIIGLLEANGIVTGAIAATSDGEDSELPADLIIDASGRSSRAPAWLKAIGFPAPSELTVNAKWGYASTFVKVPKNWNPGFRAIACLPFGNGAITRTAENRGMAMWQVEGDRRWILTVQGSAGDHPPREETQLRSFVESIGAPELSQALADVEFIDPISVWRDTTNRLRDYAKQDVRPEGFVAIGDAWAAFNPVYGQGITVAAMTAHTLARTLGEMMSEDRATVLGLADRYYASSTELITYCWNASTAMDFRIPGVEVAQDGLPQEVAAGSADFSDRLSAWMSLDPQRYVMFRETTQLIRPPDWLQSDEVVNAVKAQWDELGAMVQAR